MNAAKYVLLVVLLAAPGYAGEKPQFMLEVVTAVQTEQAYGYTVPGTPSQSRTNCNGTSIDSGTTANLNADCATTTTPGSPARSGTRYGYSEDMRVIMPDGSHLTLWCREGYRICLHLAAGKYWAERDKDTVWIYCTYADQQQWDETGMSPGQRKANHAPEKVKYHVVGTWTDDIRAAVSKPPPATESKPKGLDAGLLAFSSLSDDIHAADASFGASLRALHADEVKCGEPEFGEAFVCKANDTSVIVAIIATRPLSDIYHYWLEKISDDFLEFRRVSLLGCKDDCNKVAEFVKGGEQACQEDGSVCLKLKTAYCKEVPSGTYPDINGQSRRCGN
jgi:hypothetical protein